MKIRVGTINDYEGVLLLQLQLENVEIEFDSNLKAKSYATDKGILKLKKRIKDRNNIFYVAVNENNKIVGFIDGTIPDDEWWYKETVAYLNHICIDNDYRKQGIGKLLLKTFEEKTKKKGAKYIMLHAFLQNKPAVSFYKENGFIEYSSSYNKKL